MKTISHFSLLVIDPHFDSRDFITAVIDRNGLSGLPVNIYGIDTILEAGESRAPDAAPGAGDDPERLVARIFDRSKNAWSDETAIINVSLMDIVIAGYEPPHTFRDGKPAERGGISLLFNLLGALRDIPPFIFITDFDPKDASAAGGGESVDSLLSKLGRSRVKFKFHRQSDDPDLLREEVYRMLRENESLAEFVHLEFDDRDEKSDGDGQVWVRIRRSADSNYNSFQKLYNEIMGNKARPAGALLRRTPKGGMELFTPSVRPAKSKVSQLPASLPNGCRIMGRTWVSPKTGRVAFRLAGAPTPHSRAPEAALALGAAQNAFAGLSLYSDIFDSSFPLSPQGAGVQLSTDTLRALLAQSRLPIGELRTQLRAHLIKTREFSNTEKTLDELIAENESLFLPMAETKLSELAYERGAEKIVFAVANAETADDDPGALRVTVQALLPSPVGVTPALCYIDDLLDALRLLEAPRLLSGNTVETAMLYGLKIAPRREVYEINLEFRPRAADISRAETERFVQGTLFMLYEFMVSLIAQDLRRDISIFDLIGPSMIGPSSSHTCGANRIGRLAGRTINMLVSDSFDPERDVLCLSARLHNSFRKAGEGHRTHNALAAGLLHDIPQDHAGTDDDSIPPWASTPDAGRPENIAFFDFKPWYDGDTVKTCIWAIAGKNIDVHWAGFHKFDSSRNGADMPIPEEHPRDLHENSVAILAAVVPRGELDEARIRERFLLRNEDREFNWNDFDLVIAGESLGGGKIRIRSAGGRWVAGRTDYFTSRGWTATGSGVVFFPRDSEAPPLDGSHAKDYPGIPNLNPIYPPDGEPAAHDDALPYHDLDSMIEYANRSGRDLAQLAVEYETWCLGLKYSDGTAGKIILEAKQMLHSLDESSRPFGDIDFDSSTPETSNVINTYMNLREAFNNVNAEFLGNSFYDAVSGAITAMTRNAFSELILAAPTGGACGVLPGVYLALKNMKVRSGEMSPEEFEEKAVRALLMCGFLAALTANIVPPSGAEKGCQAETGTAAGMGAAFATYFLDGTRDQVVNAMILSMKNSLGLVCDPIAGKVNTPCIKRNAFKAIESLLGAWLSLNGIVSFVSPNQVVKAMAQIGDDMASRYRETSEGGLAKTIDGLKERMCKFG